MFKEANRYKLRFDTDRGNVTTEDLWDLPLVNKSVCLDNIAKQLSKKIKEVDEESFVVKKSSADTILELKLEIVKYIISVKLEEKEIKEKSVATKAKKERINSIIADKEDENLRNASVEDLEKMRDNL